MGSCVLSHSNNGSGLIGIDTANVLYTCSGNINYTATEDCWAWGNGDARNEYVRGSSGEQTVYLDGVMIFHYNDYSDNSFMCNPLLPLKAGQTISCINWVSGDSMWVNGSWKIFKVKK